jgi:type IV secretory pathway TraG/TraD family ATPase VirD4
VVLARGYRTQGHYGIGTNLIPIGVLIVAVIWGFHHEPQDLDHLRGLRLLTPGQHAKRLNGGWIRRIAKPHKPDGIRLGTSLIPRDLETEHIGVFGSTGAGKSVALRQLLRQIRQRGQPAIIVDTDGEFIQEFYDEERSDTVWNPLDTRMDWYWSPWGEIRDDWFTIDAAAMAASMIRGRPRDSNQEFFLESTRTVIEAMLGVVEDRENLKTLLDFVSQPREKIHQALEGTLAYPLIDPGAVEQGSGILGTAVNAIKTFQHLPRRDQTRRTGSAREWVQNPHGWIFLSSREDIRAAISPLQGLWLDLLVRWLMTTEIGSDQVWVINDELAESGRQPNILKLLTRGRKRGISVVFGLQAASQVKALYGPEDAATLIGSPSTKLIMRVDETEAAQWASDLIDSHEVERLQMAQSASGQAPDKWGLNLQPQRSIERLVLPAEIKLLEKLHGYLCIAGYHRTTTRLPELFLTEKEKKHRAFIPRRFDPPHSSQPKPVTPEPADDQIAAQLTAREEISQ